MPQPSRSRPDVTERWRTPPPVWASRLPGESRSGRIYGSEGWGFESLRAHISPSPGASRVRGFFVARGPKSVPREVPRHGGHHARPEQTCSCGRGRTDCERAHDRRRSRSGFFGRRRRRSLDPATSAGRDPVTVVTQATRLLTKAPACRYVHVRHTRSECDRGDGRRSSTMRSAVGPGRTPDGRAAQATQPPPVARVRAAAAGCPAEDAKRTRTRQEDLR